MPVYQNSGPSFGESLVRGLSAFMQARRDKEDRDLARRQAEQQAIAGGWRPGAPPTTYTDAPALTPDDLSKAFQVNAATLNQPTIDRKQRAEDDFTTGLSNAFMGRSPASAAQPAIALAKANDFHQASAARGQARDMLGAGADDRNVNFVANLTRMVNQSPSPAAQSGGPVTPSGTMRLPTTDQRYVPLSDRAGGGYVDTRAGADAQFENTMRQVMLKQAQDDATEQGYIRAGVSPERARLYRINPALAENDQTFGKHTTDVMSERLPRSFAVDGQPVEGFVDKTGKFYGADGAPVTGKVSPFVRPQSTSNVDASKRFSADQANKILDDYARDTKDFHQVMAGWDVLNGAVKNPSLATPFAVTDAYARITNPGAIVRPTTMDMIHQMGSVGQRMEKWWSQHTEGALPPDILRDFQQTLYNIVAEHKKQFDQIRTKAVRRGHDAGVDVTPYLEDYSIVNPSAVGGAPIIGGDRAQKDPGGDIDLAKANPFMTLPRRTP